MIQRQVGKARANQKVKSSLSEIEDPSGVAMREITICWNECSFSRQSPKGYHPHLRKLTNLEMTILLTEMISLYRNEVPMKSIGQTTELILSLQLFLSVDAPMFDML